MNISTILNYSDCEAEFGHLRYLRHFFEILKKKKSWRRLEGLKGIWFTVLVLFSLQQYPYDLVVPVALLLMVWHYIVERISLCLLNIVKQKASVSAG